MVNAVRWKILSFLMITVIFVLLTSARLLQGAESGQLRLAAGEGITEETGLSLTEGNLVDVLTALPLHLKLARAELKGSRLAVDLKVQDNTQGTTSIYADMSELAGLALVRSDNISQLRLRLIAEDAWTNSRHLLLAAEMDRTELTGEAEQAIEQLKNTGDNPLDQVLKEKLHIVETPLWKRSFPKTDY